MDRFRRVRLASELRAPMQLAVAPDSRVFVVERAGRVLVYDPAARQTEEVAKLEVDTSREHGLLGLALDPDFLANGWVYLAYSRIVDAGTEVRLSRFTFDGGVLALGSERVLLSFLADGDCCHAAGSLAFGPEGNLYFSTGDDASPFDTDGYAPIDERPGRRGWDAQRSASNTMDLRGKILRLTPRADGSYTIPPGNLFPLGSGRPEIYAMGLRNPFRFSLDPRTGWLYFGDVGPDARSATPARGPRGYDEINRARIAGNYGWPYCLADNQPYVDYDFATGVSGAAFDCAAPTNDSPNNSGSMMLPPARPALIWYPYADSPEFPQLGNGESRTALAGPVYRRPPARQISRRAFPSHYDGDLFIYDWSRSWVKTVHFNGEGDPVKISPFGSHWEFLRPIDMEFARGVLYMLEWGRDFSGQTDAGLYKIDFKAEENRPKLHVASSR
jgi:cytochrome c